jgi:hypothetical protein
MLQGGLEECLSDGGEVEFLIGLDSAGTEPKAVWKLFDYSQRFRNCFLYCYSSAAQAGIYHPKVYLLRNDAEVLASVGSSNLTVGGLAKNTEVNVVLRGNVESESIADLYGAYSFLKFHPDRVIPDEEFLSLYEKLAQRENARRRVSATNELRVEFLNKAASLQRPRPTSRDLVGWLRLVFEVLPRGDFTNADVYEHSVSFSDRYPGNLNVNAKIRQQLQILRNMQLIEHLGASRWRRL